MTKATQILLPLQRPQYMAISEGFINALAWSLYEPFPSEAGKKIGLRFRGENTSNKNLVLKFTEPVEDKLELLERELKDSGFLTSSSDQVLNQAVINSILGIRTDGGKFQPASPLTLHLALLQNTEGIFGSENPPPIAGIIDRIFALGVAGEGARSASQLWLGAAKHRTSIDPILAAIDQSIATVVFEGKLSEKVSATALDVSGWKEVISNSPFTWFARMWERITSEEWVEALPARVWTDWATTLLRTAFGLVYLWESAWYEAIAKTVVSGSSDVSVQEIRTLMDQTLPWRKASSGADIRDLAARIKTRSQKAFEVRAVLEAWSKTLDTDEMSFAAGIQALQEDKDIVRELRKALVPKKIEKIGKSLKEAIRYSLLTRESAGESTDYYGLLRKSGRRYLFPDPGIEWISVNASLSCVDPGGKTYLGVVARDLADAGLKPDTEELISLLEKAGLARGSADADQGVTVEAAF